MLKNERAQEIIGILKENGFCTVKQLSERLYTSESSIRRTLAFLSQAGLIKRSYGGAELLNTHTAVAKFNTRTRQNTDAKRKMAKKAIGLLRDGDVIFLDQSSSALYVAYELSVFKDLTVVTNSLEIMNVLSPSDITVYSSGGMLTRTGCIGFIGADAEKTFKKIYADFCFFSAKSLSDDGTVTDCRKEETDVRNAMFENAQNKVFLCDSSKFGSVSAFKQCRLSDVDYLITEDENSPILKKFEKTVKIF